MTAKPDPLTATEGKANNEKPSQNATAADLRTKACLAASIAEGRRLVSQGAVKIAPPDGGSENLTNQSAPALQEGDTKQAGPRQATLN